jgi:hypothetical protein
MIVFDVMEGFELDIAVEKTGGMLW